MVLPFKLSDSTNHIYQICITLRSLQDALAPIMAPSKVAKAIILSFLLKNLIIVFKSSMELLRWRCIRPTWIKARSLWRFNISFQSCRIFVCISLWQFSARQEWKVLLNKRKLPRLNTNKLLIVVKKQQLELLIPKVKILWLYR